MAAVIDLINQDFGTIAALVRFHARNQPHSFALKDNNDSLTYAQLDERMDKVAACLQRDGVVAGDVIALCADNSVSYALIFLGALRAGVAVAPLAPSASAQSLHKMVADAQAKIIFADANNSAFTRDFSANAGTLVVGLSHDALNDWLASSTSDIMPCEVQAATPFNIIYSSGTTGEPKGIVQGHGMRWAHIKRSIHYNYCADSVTLLSTPLYSNTTLVVFFPTLAFGGCVVLMPKFNALQYLALAQTHHVTHTMLVPVQYQRLMAVPTFDEFDLNSFVMKFCTSAPFSANLKADILRRWPGGLTEFYGMTEGGGTLILEAHNHPDKLHTVGKPALGSDIRLISDDGFELSAQDQLIGGEIIGHSAGMMTGYHGQPEKTREVEWFDQTGKRFIRTGDVGRFDPDGFLILFDRKKDVIISGGFNIYPSDIEAVLREYPCVSDVAVVGIESAQWGETPAAFVVLMANAQTTVAVLMNWANQRLGKTQRLASITAVDELPRSAIGKVLKRELRARLKHALP